VSAIVLIVSATVLFILTTRLIASLGVDVVSLILLLPEKTLIGVSIIVVFSFTERRYEA